jgi:hypothetical protein
LEDFLETANREGVTTIMINKELTGILEKIYRLGYRFVAVLLILGLLAAYLSFRRADFLLEAWITGGFALILAVLFLRTFWKTF